MKTTNIVILALRSNCRTGRKRLPLDLGNIQHPTSNTQHPMTGTAAKIRDMLGVGPGWSIRTLLAAGLVLLASVAPLAATDTSAADRVGAFPLFLERIQWVGPQAPSEAESAELLGAMQAYEERGCAPLDEFIVAHPKSAWGPCLRVNLAEFYRARGRYSVALAHYEAAWAATRSCTSRVGQDLAARSAAGLASLLAGQGQKEELGRLLREIDQSPVPLGIYSSTVSEARSQWQTMQQRPGDAFKCGLIALNHLAAALHAETTLPRYWLHTASPDGGFTLAQLLSLGQTNGLDLEAVRRPAGADLIVPCVIHWKYNHYAVVASVKEGQYRVVETTLDRSVCMTAVAIDAESSGVLLVPRDRAPASWQKLTLAECGQIRGGCYGPPPQDADDDDPDCEGGDEGSCDDPCDPPSANDGASGGGDGGCPPDEDAGMPRWRVSEPYINLWLHDTPLRYRLSSGHWMSLKLSYKQRSGTEGWSASFPSFGKNWSCNWLGRVDQNPSGTFQNRMAGGGVRVFQPSVTDYKSGRNLSVGYSVGETLSGGSFYSSVISHPVIRSPLGSQNLYAFAYHNPLGTSYLLTHRADRYGRTVSYNYVDNSTYGVRLATVTDLDGRTVTLGYGDARDANHTNLITSVTDPYNRTCSFGYDESCRLWRIQDTMGMVTILQYDSNNFVTNMITPYGETHFESFEGQGRRRSDNRESYSENRALRVTEANGKQQLYAYCGEGPWDYCGGDGEAEFRNSYHWNRLQYDLGPAAHPGNPLNLPDADYFLASIQHWLHADSTMGAVCDTVGAQAGPVDPLLPGHHQRAGIRSFWYQGQTGANYPGTLKRVVTIWDGSWQPYFDITRNSLGRPVVLTYYNSDGTSASYTNIYDPSGTYLQSEYGPRGEQVRGYGYNNAQHPNLLTSVTNALGEVIRYTHDPSTLHVTSITFPSGLVRTNVYFASDPSKGFLQIQADLGLRTSTFTYTNGNVLAHTDELGLATTNTWDDLNRLVNTGYPDGTTVSNLYDKLDVVGVKDRLDQWTHYGFNPVRQLDAITNANQQVTLIDYCSCGSPTEISRLNGTDSVTNHFLYDIAGRLTNTLYADFYQVNRSYDQDNLLQILSDSGGRSVVMDYARHGLDVKLAHAYMVAADSSQHLVLGQQFDEYGRVTNSVDRNAVATVTAYDFLDRMTNRQVFGSSGVAESGAERFVYDARGLTNYFDSLARPTVFVRDTAGRELYVTNANLEVLQFAYDAADDLLSLTDGKSQTTSWKYDSYGQVTNKLDANNLEMFRYQYDPNGRLTNRWQAGGVVTTYRYDALGNLTNVIYPGDPDLNCVFQSDGLNRLTSMVDTNATNSFTWTKGDQLESETGPWPTNRMIYGYNNRMPQGFILEQPYAQPWVQGDFYDEFGRLRSVTNKAGVFGYQYRPGASDLVEQISYPPGGFSMRSYDDLGRLQSTTLVGPVGDVPDFHGYTYDAGSQRRQQVFAAGNYVIYDYDNIGQLKAAKGFERSGSGRLHEQFGYAYDAAWNLNWRTNNFLVQQFGVNNLNELTNVSRTLASTLTVAGATSLVATNVKVNGMQAQLYSDGTFAREGYGLTNGLNGFTAEGWDAQGEHATTSVSVNLPSAVNYSYDARGNLTNDGLRTFEYDAENQLKAVMVPSAWRSEFEHDGLLRRRVRREYTRSGGGWVKTNEVRYVYDRLLVVQERDTNSAPLVTYTRGNDLSGSLQGAGGIGGLLARTDNLLFAIGNPNAHAYYHADGNGNVTCSFDSSGTVVARYSYDPFGNTLAISGTLANGNLYRFSSKEYHQNSGLVYYLYRYYDPNLQRWTNRDPIGEEGGMNLYGFVFNNPPELIDGDGRCLPAILVGIGLYFSWEHYVNAPRNTEDAHNPSYSKWNSTDNPLSMVGQFPAKNLAPNLVKTMARDQVKKGVIYRVQGKDTPSKKEYVGRTTNPRGPPGRGKRDGRDRTNARVVGHYDTTQEGRIKEQREIDANGGIGNLDNKRNEIAPGRGCPP
jgi:RHS repeat-associated protein